MAAITSVNAAQAIVKLVAAQGLPAVIANMVMGNLVNRSYEPVLAQAGDTVNVPIPPVMVANNIAEGGSVQTQNPSLGNAQIVLNTHAEASFQIPDVTAVLTGAESGNFDLLNKFLQPAMNAIATRVETDLLQVAIALSANSAVGTGNTTITESVIDLAEKALFDALVPQEEPKYLVLSSQAYSDARQIERFTEQRMNGNGEAINSGTIGRIKDFSVYRSQLVYKPSTTTYNLAFARDAIGLVVRKLPNIMPGTGAIAEFLELGSFGLRVVMSYAPNSLSQQFTVDVLYGCGPLRQIYGVQVLT